MTAALVLALAAGVALAVNKMCLRNCRGTGEDQLKGGNARDDVFSR